MSAFVRFCLLIVLRGTSNQSELAFKSYGELNIFTFMVKKQYPYKETSVASLKGERWKDMPGVEGYYKVSNWGRVKRLEYERQYRNGAIYTMKEKIIKPLIVRQYNHFKGDYLDFLTIRVTVEGVRHNYMLARLVYYCFVQKFDLTDKRVIILNKDADPLNVLPANLIRGSLSDRSQRAFDKNRTESPFKYMDDAGRLVRLKAMVKKLSKTVSQYDLKGKKIKTFSSIAAASRATGVDAQAISLVTRGGGFSAGGYIWRPGKEAKVDIRSARQEQRMRYIKKYGRKITQYDLKGRRIARFPGVREASEATGVHVNAINLILRGIYKSSKGFFFRKGYGPAKIDLKNYRWGHKSGAVKRWVRVVQYSLEGKRLKEFESIKAAAAALGVPPASISTTCRGGQKTCGGFIWKYAKKK